jgi:hypothetical protein
MIINRDFYKKKFYKKPLSFPCPSCINGHVTFKDENIRIDSTVIERKTRNSFLSFNSGDVYRMAAVSFCSLCEDPLSVIGTAKYYDNSSSPVSSDYLGGKKYLGFTPLFFHPPLNIFPVSDYCPKEIQKTILLAFSHYWNDTSASANSIRTAVELILNEQKIEKGDKENKLKLHARIELYKKKNKELGTRLMAVKWIGNEGSHEGILSADNILDGFEILYSVIHELYDLPNQNLRINELADKINENKGISKSE